jgi:hypothetical protein
MKQRCPGVAKMWKCVSRTGHEVWKIYQLLRVVASYCECHYESSYT